MSLAVMKNIYLLRFFLYSLGIELISWQSLVNPIKASKYLPSMVAFKV
jgi:hypothetical protein